MVASFLCHHHTNYDLNAQSRKKGAGPLELDWFNSQGPFGVTSPYNVIENDENILGQTFIIYNLVPKPF